MIDPIPDQDPGAVAFTWEPTSWSESELKIKVSFASPYEVSADYEKNQLQVRVWNEELFIRKEDFVQLPFTDEARNLTKTIPLQISEGAAAALTAVGDSVGSGGQILTIGILVLNLVASYSMN